MIECPYCTIRNHICLWKYDIYRDEDQEEKIWFELECPTCEKTFIKCIDITDMAEK